MKDGTSYARIEEWSKLYCEGVTKISETGQKVHAQPDCSSVRADTPSVDKEI